MKRLSNLVNDFEQVRSKQLGSADLTDVAQAMIAGQVGKLDAASGRGQFGELAHLDVGDLLDDFAEITLKLRGEVVVVPAERMTTATVHRACLHDCRICSLGKVHRQTAKRYSRPTRMKRPS